VDEVIRRATEWWSSDLNRAIAWDERREVYQHAEFTVATGVPI
jgi:hypothetical protein